MIYIFLNGYLPAVSTRLGTGSSHDLGHRSDGYLMESHVPQGLKKPQKMFLCLFRTYMAPPRGQFELRTELEPVHQCDARTSHPHTYVNNVHHIHTHASTMCVELST